MDALFTQEEWQDVSDVTYRIKKVSELGDRARFLYTKFFEKFLLPEIRKISQQPEHGYHGIDHTEQVGLFGLDYVMSLNENPLPVLYAAALHDCARMGDKYSAEHGPNCEPIARAFLNTSKAFLLSPDEKEMIIRSIVNHTSGLVAPDYISACLWDADRTRVSWDCGYVEGFFNTERGKYVASLDEEGQQEYWNEMMTFLETNNLNSTPSEEVKQSFGYSPSMHKDFVQIYDALVELKDKTQIQEKKGGS